MVFWEVNDIQFDNINDLLQYVFDSEWYYDVVDVDDYIDEHYEAYTIEGKTYSASEILYNTDSDAYYDLKQSLAETKASEDASLFKDQLLHMNDGDSIEINDYEITYHDESRQQTITGKELRQMLEGVQIA